MSNSNFNPTPCNQGVLNTMAHLAQQVDAPIAPYPIFFSNAQCGESLTGSSFPSYFLPVKCRWVMLHRMILPTIVCG